MFGDGEVLGVRSQGLGSRGDKWPMVKIEEVGFITSGGTPSRARPEYYNGKIRWYSAGELNSLYLPDSVEHITEKALQESSAKLFKKGSLLIGMYDTAAFKMGILTEDASSNQACANLTPYEDYNVVWLYYLFEKMKPIFLKERQGVRQKNLSLSKIKNFQIPIVPLSLQREVAASVAKVDKLAFKAKASLEKLETLKKAMMQKYFG
jgi:type I restriction enzyme S subunit